MLEEAGVSAPPRELPTSEEELVRWLSSGVSTLASVDV